MAMTAACAVPARREVVAATLVAVLLLVVCAWPWVRDAARAIPDAAAVGNAGWGADARLIVWILSWDVHALLTQPLRFFDANIFHPAPRMLCGSEHLLSSVLLSGPVFLLSGNPVLAANVAALATYVLAAVFMYVLLRRLGLSGLAASVGAMALPLGPLRVPGDLHVLQYPNYILPLLLLAALAVHTRPTRLRLVGLAAAATFALFTSYYMAVMAAAVIVVEVLLSAAGGAPRTALRLFGATVPAFGLLAIFSLPYLPHTHLQAEKFSLDLLVILFFLRPVFHFGNLHYGIGWGVGGLAVVGLLQPVLLRRWPAARWWRWLALVLAGYLLVCAPLVPFVLPSPLAEAAYAFWVAVRASPRFIILSHLGASGLAAEGAALLLAWAAYVAGHRVPVRILVAGICLAAAAMPRALDLTSLPRTELPTGASVPPVYRLLASVGEGPVLEIPPPQKPQSIGNFIPQSEAMYFSIYHWLPLVNGHTRLLPWWFGAVSNELAQLPEPRALQAVVDLTGIRWIVVRRSAVSPEAFARWAELPARVPGIHQVGPTEPDLLFNVVLPERYAWAQALATGHAPPGRTILGTPLIRPAGREFAGRVLGPPHRRKATAGRTLGLRITARNVGAWDWPALAEPWAADTHLVVLTAIWEDAASGAGRDQERIRLPRDVPAGDEVTFTPLVRTPAGPGSYDLVLGLEQVDGPPASRVVPLRLSVDVEAAPAPASERSGR